MDAAMLEIKLMRRMTQDQKIMFQMQHSAARKSPSTALILSLFALSRFYLGQVGLGLLQWLSVSFFGIGLIWVVLDILQAKSRAEQYNAASARRIACIVTGDADLANLGSDPPQSLLAQFNEFPLLTKIILSSLLVFMLYAFYRAHGL
jgi:TM2 domain-containing membrane protein YozV